MPRPSTPLPVQPPAATSSAPVVTIRSRHQGINLGKNNASQFTTKVGITTIALPSQTCDLISTGIYLYIEEILISALLTCPYCVCERNNTEVYTNEIENPWASGTFQEILRQILAHYLARLRVTQIALAQITNSQQYYSGLLDDCFLKICKCNTQICGSAEPRFTVSKNCPITFQMYRSPYLLAN